MKKKILLIILAVSLLTACDSNRQGIREHRFTNSEAKLLGDLGIDGDRDLVAYNINTKHSNIGYLNVDIELYEYGVKKGKVHSFGRPLLEDNRLVWSRKYLKDLNDEIWTLALGGASTSVLVERPANILEESLVREERDISKLEKNKEYVLAILLASESKEGLIFNGDLKMSLDNLENYSTAYVLKAKLE